ncbi:MAG: hypothetical protein AAFY65_06055 [Pseudomonadota bacterium]
MKPLRPASAKAAASHDPAPHAVPMKTSKKKKKKKKKKSKGFFRKLAEEVWDEIEDVFD